MKFERDFRTSKLLVISPQLPACLYDRQGGTINSATLESSLPQSAVAKFLMRFGSLEFVETVAYKCSEALHAITKVRVVTLFHKVSLRVRVKDGWLRDQYVSSKESELRKVL